MRVLVTCRRREFHLTMKSQWFVVEHSKISMMYSIFFRLIRWMSVLLDLSNVQKRREFHLTMKLLWFVVEHAEIAMLYFIFFRLIRRDVRSVLILVTCRRGWNFTWQWNRRFSSSMPRFLCCSYLFFFSFMVNSLQGCPLCFHLICNVAWDIPFSAEMCR